MKIKLLLVRVLLSVFVLLLIACDNGTDSVFPPGNRPVEPPAVHAIDYFKMGDDPFSRAVVQTGILDELDLSTLPSIFFPLEEWFEQEGVSTAEFLSHPQLKEIISYHLLTSRLGELRGGLTLEPGAVLPTLLDGKSITVSQRGETYYLNGTTKLVTPPSAFPTTYEVDVLLVDQLLLPPGVTLE